MLSISIRHGRISKAFLFNSPCFYLRFLHYSTTSPSSDLQPHFVIDYLIDSLGFSKQEAINASTKIKSIVISQPNILLSKVDKTLEPKFKILHEIGLSGSDLVAVIKRDPNFLGRGLHTSIIPVIGCLRKILGSDEKIVKVMKRFHWPGKFFRTNMVLLERFGVLNKDIEKVIIRNPGLFTRSPAWLEEKLIGVERELGIMRGSAMFSYGLTAICSLNKSSLQKKFGVFKSSGWCDSDIYTIVRSQPICLTHSEERLSKGLNFFMKELSFTPSLLANCGSFLMYSLEKRVKPRFQVFSILKEKGVLGKEFQSILPLSDVDFLEKIVQRYKEEIPDELYASFTTKNLKL